VIDLSIDIPLTGIEIPVMGNMTGTSGRLQQNDGSIAFIRPSQYRVTLEYINIQNTTENTLSIFSLNDDTNSATPVYEIGARMTISLKLTQRLTEGVIITFVNPNPATIGQIKSLEIIWSEYSKGWGNSLAPSYSSQYTGTSVNIINVPHTIVDSGSIAVSNIPHTIVDSGSVTVSNIPHVIVDSGTITPVNDYVTPLTGSQNNTALVLTAPAVSAKRNYCSYISLNTHGGAIGASDVPVQIKDGANVIYDDIIPTTSIAGFRLIMNFTPPLQCAVNSALTLNIGASGTAGTIIKGNIGYLNK